MLKWITDAITDALPLVVAKIPLYLMMFVSMSEGKKREKADDGATVTDCLKETNRLLNLIACVLFFIAMWLH